MFVRSTLLMLACVLPLTGCVFYVNGAHSEPLNHGHRTLQLNAAEIQQLTADTGAGDLVIVGVAEQQQITVDADVYDYPDVPAKLTLEQHGTQAVLVAKFDSHFSINRNSPYINLRVTVPAAMVLDVTDGSGQLEIRDMTANIKVVDGSGDLTIRGAHDLDINDGSGSVTLANISGKIRLDDGSGDIDIRDVGGDIRIDDGSGSMTVKNVQGTVTIDDGSGDIDVRHTQGLNIINAGSGDVHFDNINGPVTMDK
ncbi:DUF4097 family beta strand repeat-containing protein [Shewanella dokdonensis]|uniref:DUF4097 family beta strand repeat protein n=1 Tax=Shewanella dokdonensis TaxID=712036 RepID=A0ABX8DIN2_9GAMM|nr:DUF4097 family beta strand repeat-containing protein [Shewanella dokdonensis]MCL1075656.1 DUF4097 domain-containing protein [Shewanella dokdonensis]QVK24653.1 DUF4097 family beta strand repeat protein [Shewanella dokdonensis]